MFSIKDIENLSGIKAHTIRIWEQRYGFLKPQRTGTNIRYYSNNELKMILNVSLLNKYGYKISHINKMAPDIVKEKILSLTHAAAFQERIINDLLQHMVDLNTTSFERDIDNCIQVKGIEKTISHIIFPFLEKIGVLWSTSHIVPGQEHLVTNIIRQKLIMGIENVKNFRFIDKSVVLFLPENEFHELPLLFVQYLLKSHGVKIFYAGANIPLKDVEYICRQTEPDYIYSHLTALPNSFNLDKIITSLSSHFLKSKIILSGRMATMYKKEIPSNVFIKRSFAEVIDYVANV